LLAAHLTLAEYPRLKYRGPPPFPKPPPFHHYAKKWQQHPPRPPIRARPIPVHMPNHHKIPMGVSASVNRPVAVPVRAFWKHTQTTFRTPVETHYMTSAPVLPKKVFQSSPAILAQEYDFHVQSNNIPTPIKTIKQIGEKGPIHTIPAPNLSPADKPLVLEELKPQVQRQHEIQRQPEVVSYVQIQKAHQYQVTEAPELAYKNYFDNSYHSQNLGTNLGPNELYHLINAYSQQSPTIAVPILQESQQDYLQQFPSLLPQQPQNFVDQLSQEHVAMDKSSFDEPAQKKELSTSLVTAAYNLEPEASESVVHSQYVQNFFDTRQDGNNVEPDAKPSEKNDTTQPEGFYVSLPNKETAESLASLQAAGKLNSNLMQMAKNKVPVSIYVPDDETRSRDGASQSRDDDEPTYDDYDQSEEDLMTEEAEQDRDDAFGHRLRPKT
jgi:hypothetical protein